MKRKSLIVLGVSVLVVALVAGGVVGCARAPKEWEKEWNIQAITELTGGFSTVCTELQWAADREADIINAGGGVAGRPMRFTWYDSASEPSKARASMARLLDTNPIIVLQGGADIQGSACLQLGAEQKVFCISPTTGARDVRTFEPWGNTQMSYDEYQCGLGDVAWVQREGIKSVCPLYNSAGGWYVDCAGLRCEALEAIGVTVTEPVTYDQFATVDYGPLAVAALATGAEGFMFTSHGSSVGNIIAELTRRGVTDASRICIQSCGDYPELYEIAEGCLEGAYIVSNFDIFTDNPRWHEAVAAYKDYCGIDAGFGIWLGMDCPWMIKAAIEDTGVTGDPAKLVEERQLLADYCYNLRDFPFVMGKIDVIDGVIMHPVYLNQIWDQEKTFIEEVPCPGVPADLTRYYK